MAQQVTVEDVKTTPGAGVFPPTEGGTVSVSEDGGEAKPVAEIPRQAAEPLRTEVSLTPDPVIGVSVQTKDTGDVSQQAAESIASQITPSFESMVERATGAEKMRLMSMQELAEAGDAKAKMRMMSMLERQTPSADETVKAFVDPSGEPMTRSALQSMFPRLDDPFAYDQMTLIGRQQADLDNMLRETVTDPRVRQIIVDNGLASAPEVAAERTAEIGRATVNIASLIGGEGPYATAAYYAGLALTDVFSGRASDFATAYDSYAAEIKRDSEANLDQMESVFGKVGLNVTIGRKLDKFVKDQLKQKLDSGIISQEEYNETVFETVDGQQIEKALVNEETAQNLQSLFMSELPLQAQFGVIAFENIVGMAGFAGAKVAKGNKTLKQVLELKEEFPTLTKGMEDPRLILKTVQAADEAKKINKKFLAIGMRNERVDSSVTRLSNDIEELHDELANMRLNGDSIRGSSNYAKYISKKQEVNLLQSRMLKAKFTGKTIPFVAEGVENALVISAGQLAARELLPGFTGLDPDTAEAIGAISMGIGGYKLVKKVGGGIGKPVLRLVDGNVSGTVTSGLARTMDFLAYVSTAGTVGRISKAQGKSIFGDDTIKLYEQSLGRKLTPDERRGITYTSRLMQNMDEEERETVFKAQQQYMDLQERIVSKFPEGEAQEKAKELFSLSFAQGSAISPLAALNRLETGKLNVRDLKSMDGEAMSRLSKQQENQIALTEEALDNFERLLNETGDMTGKEDVSSWIMSARNAVTTHKQNLRKDSEDYLAALDELETLVFNDVTTEIPSDFFENLLTTRKTLAGSIGKVFDEKAEIIRLQKVFQEGLTSRIEIIKDMRGKGSRHRVLLDNTAEDLVDTHVEALQAKGKSAYSGIVEFAETRPKIDMTPVVQKMLGKLGRMSDIEIFFSAGGDFFKGKIGRQTQEVFQNMVDRVLPPEELEYMKGLLRANNIDTDELTDIEVALRADAAANGGLRVFSQANPYEIEVMRRAVRDYAARIDPQNKKELRSIANDFKTDLDNLISTQDKEMYDKLVAARFTYRSEVGDRLRPGQPLTRVLHARTGPEIAERPVDASFRHFYTGNLDPTTMFNPVSESLNTIAEGGRKAVKAKQTIGRKLDELTVIFGDRVDGVSVFDLTTEEGKSKFDTIQTLMEERIYADWAEGTLAAIKQPRATRVSIQKSIGGYDFTRSTDFEALEDNMQVSVRKLNEKTGEIETVKIPLVRTGEMIASERDITRLIDESSAIKKRYDEFVVNATSETSKLRRNVDTAVKNESEVFDDLKPILNVTDPAAFYKKNVLEAGEDAFDVQREIAVKLLQKSGMNVDEAADAFDSAAKDLVVRALMERGGRQAVQGRTIVGLNKDKTVVHQFTTPEIMMKDIQENRKTLNNIMGKKHVDYLEEIAEFINMTAQSSVGNTSFEGLVKGYGTNEALSRVYNMARGMVSPLYVTSEFAVRLAAQANVEMLQLAGKDMNAARIMTNMMKYPDLVTRQDMDYLEEVTLTFVLAEIAKRPTTYQQAASLPDMLGAAGETTTPDKEEE
jgi:hypothetical protein